MSKGKGTRQGKQVGLRSRSKSRIQFFRFKRKAAPSVVNSNIQKTESTRSKPKSRAGIVILRQTNRSDGGFFLCKRKPLRRTISGAATAGGQARVYLQNKQVDDGNKDACDILDEGDDNDMVVNNNEGDDGEQLDDQSLGNR